MSASEWASHIAAAESAANVGNLFLSWFESYALSSTGFLHSPGGETGTFGFDIYGNVACTCFQCHLRSLVLMEDCSVIFAEKQQDICCGCTCMIESWFGCFPVLGSLRLTRSFVACFSFMLPKSGAPCQWRSACFRVDTFLSQSLTIKKNRNETWRAALLSSHTHYSYLS
eukprot:TRINITY_DN3515_c0_g2_i2.p1 TRINITY_DN3515_c0_g2~~TRINITY_DN3515_c0_g2_i2.p1  ORF type:complete len:170 (-),score=12.23 TRINITY_DN3515_c0_g2_i2:79-588(-)